MELGRITAKQHDLVRDAVSDTEKMRNRAERFLSALSEVAAEPCPRAEWGVVFEVGEDGIIDIKTPYGDARAWIEMSVGDHGTQATINFEKAGRNELDLRVWRLAWQIQVAPNGYYAGNDYSAKINTDPFNNRNLYVEAILSMLYAIAKT